MKIGIDYRLNTSNSSNSNRGMARGCRDIVRSIIRYDYENEYIIYAYDTISQDDKMIFADVKNVKIILMKKVNYIIDEQCFLPILARQTQIDVLWCPYNTFPLLLTKKCRLIITLHDLMFLLPPVGKESTMQKIGRFYRKLTISAGKRRIDTCITISKYSAEQIKSKLNISSTCIPTYNGISHFSELFGIEMSCPVKRKDFYFTVSGDAPSKNISFLLEIFNTDLCRDTLIIAGIKNNSYLRKKEYPNIIFLNENISDTNLIHFYRTCKAFILPSLREGFGVPILEALLCGAPIIASNRTAIPEVLNGFGILFDPEDRKSFLNAINEINNFVVSETEIQEYLDKYIHNKKTILQILDVFNKADGVGGSYPCK